MDSTDLDRSDRCVMMVKPRFYDKRAWRDGARRNALERSGYKCMRCGASITGKGQSNVHHVHAVEDAPHLALAGFNHVALCVKCHAAEENGIRAVKGNARPDWLPMPKCRVVLVCGPPASGKSTWVRQQARQGDIEIDLDAIAKDMGFGRGDETAPVGLLLRERNSRLAALARAARSRTAYVILTAASEVLRAWWQHTLGVAAADVIVLKPSREELRRRVLADPDRRWVVDLHFRLIDQWFDRERGNDPGFVSAACDEKGMPLDPLHPWNRTTREMQPGGAKSAGGGGMLQPVGEPAATRSIDSISCKTGLERP